MARILIVDDSIMSRNALRGILSEGGHEVIGEAGDGEEALTLYDSLKPDIVTLDITMPRLSGLDCLKKLMSQDPQARVMMLTALGQGSKVLEALENGARHYLTKPYDYAKVLEAVDWVLSN